MWASTIAAIALSTFTVSLSSREVETETLVKCNAVHSDGSMFVAWGVPKDKCMKECGPTSGDEKKEWTYEKQFTKAFAISLGKTSRCECRAGEKLIVTYAPFDVPQAEECLAGGGIATQALCWEMYKRARGTRYSQLGIMTEMKYTVPFKDAEFIVNKSRCSDFCADEKSCSSVTLPGALQGMTHEEKVAAGQGIKDMMDGQNVPRPIAELIQILPPEDLDAAEFAFMDVSKDGELSVAELGNFYTHFTADQIERFVNQVDEDSNGKIDFGEFHAFKNKLRDFDPKKDVITGERPAFVVVDGKVQEYIEDLDVSVGQKGEWKAVKVECMVDGQPVSADQCEGTAEEALAKKKDC